MKGDGSGFDLAPDFGNSTRTARPLSWPQRPERPMPILTVTGSSEPKDIQWYLGAVTSFVNSYLETNVRYLSFRVRPLLGIPLVGAGKGGAGTQIAVLINRLLDLCQELTKEHNIDLAIVVKDSFHYSACQKERRKRDPSTDLWPTLSAEQRKSGMEIATHAHKGELVYSWAQA